MMDGATEAASVSSRHRSAQAHQTRRALNVAKPHLQRSALRLAGYLLAAYLVLKLIPALEQALSTLMHVSWPWVLGGLALETVSEMGFVVSWGAIVDPESLLIAEGRGERLYTRVAWAQLGGGTLVPGGSYGGLGVGAWILHRSGMPTKLIAEREFNLSFLNTAVDALALIAFGVGLATGVLPGPRNLLLTLLPAAAAAAAVAAALLVARRAVTGAERKPIKHARVGGAIATLSEAVNDTQRLLFHRGGRRAVLRALVYLLFDLLYQAIGLLVPLAGGGIAYAILRGQLGQTPTRASEESG